MVLRELPTYTSVLVDSSCGRKVRREKRPRNDWQVRPTDSRRAATAKAASGKIVIDPTAASKLHAPLFGDLSSTVPDKRVLAF